MSLYSRIWWWFISTFCRAPLPKQDQIGQLLPGEYWMTRKVFTAMYPDFARRCGDRLEEAGHIKLPSGTLVHLVD